MMTVALSTVRLSTFVVLFYCFCSNSSFNRRKSKSTWSKPENKLQSFFFFSKWGSFPKNAEMTNDGCSVLILTYLQLYLCLLWNCVWLILEKVGVWLEEASLKGKNLPMSICITWQLMLMTGTWALSRSEALIVALYNSSRAREWIGAPGAAKRCLCASWHVIQ